MPLEARTLSRVAQWRFGGQRVQTRVACISSQRTPSTSLSIDRTSERHASMRSTLVAALLAPLALSPVALAQTIFVTTAADTTDFGGAQRVANLPGPDGKVSLAEAAIASDNTPGVQTIGFHIPQNEWTFQYLYPGRAVLTIFLGFNLHQPVIIDGTTQTAFTGDTNPAGCEVVIMSSMYVVGTTGSVVKGLDSTAIAISEGSANVVQGNTMCGIEVYNSPGTLVGGTNPGEGNTAHTIKIDRTSDNVVVGNTCQRVRVLGGGAFEPQTMNNRVGGPSLAERNYITGYGSFNSEGCPGGMGVQIFQAIGTVVENNWIGTTPDGMAQGNPATVVGIVVEGVSQDTIIRNNRIAGIKAIGQFPHCAGFIYGTGIRIDGTGSNVAITGNTIGLNANGQPVLGGVEGITILNYFQGPTVGVTIGGSAPGEGNEIAGHSYVGVLVNNTLQDVTISGNSIHDNGGLGIDLITTGFTYGVSPNDATDADAGANGLQNFPVLSAATSGPSGTDITGTLQSIAGEAFRVEFFASPTCDANGYGEGRTFLGTTEVTTNLAGSAAINAHVSGVAQAGSMITATATRVATKGTSEFSACIPVAIACVGDLNGNDMIDAGDLGVLLGAWGNAGGAADLNSDGTVDAADLATLLGAWGACG